MPVGPYWEEKENMNGKQMGEFMERSGRVALNTWSKGASGKTYYGNGETRVDFVLVTRNFMESRWTMERCTPWQYYKKSTKTHQTLEFLKV